MSSRAKISGIPLPLPPPPQLQTHPLPSQPTIPSPPPTPSTSPSPSHHRIELLIYNGHPFKDHWSYFVQSRNDPNIGVKIHATGNVREGFVYEAKRAIDLTDSEHAPSKRVPLQWLPGEYFSGDKMLNGGVYGVDYVPQCAFEESVFELPVPGKSLDSISEGKHGGKIVQRDCQTWMVESAEHLAGKGIFDDKVVQYLRATQQ